MTSPTFDVSAFGGACWDLLGLVSSYPALDQKVQIEDLSMQGGGLAGTAAVTVARLGGRVAIFARIGDDLFGERIRSGFEDEGVDTTWLMEVPGARSHFAICVVDGASGKRTIFYDYGSKGQFSSEEVDWDALLDCRCLMCDSHHGEISLEAVLRAREAGVPVVLDIERDKPGNSALLTASSHPVLPMSYALELSGCDSVEEAGRELLSRGPEAVVITRGAEGATGFQGAEVIHQPAVSAGPVVDTTGAGDVFHGAFAYGIALGHDLARNLRFAATVAGLKCRKLGGRAGIPTMDEVREQLSRL